MRLTKTEHSAKGGCYGMPLVRIVKRYYLMPSGKVIAITNTKDKYDNDKE